MVLRLRAGADLRFSRGGGGFSKIFENFVDLFLGRTKRPCFGQNFCAAGKMFEKNRPKTAFLGLFGRFLRKKRRFFGAPSTPKKLAYIGPKGAFRKTFGSVSQKWISLNSTKKGSFGSAGRVSNPREE